MKGYDKLSTTTSAPINKSWSPEIHVSPAFLQMLFVVQNNAREAGTQEKCKTRLRKGQVLSKILDAIAFHFYRNQQLAVWEEADGVSYRNELWRVIEAR